MVRKMSPLIRGRYAPSPSGALHLGNLRTALLAWLFTRCAAGSFVLRIEDLDRPRVRPGSASQILLDLRWLGLDWDEGPDVGGSFAPYTQSERQEHYTASLQRLVAADLVYPCYCSRATIARFASAPHGEDGPRYPGTCRNLSLAQRRRYQREGRAPALRFRVDDTRTVTFTDLIVGQVSQQVQQGPGDFVLQRADGIFTYQFAVVVDDGMMQINQVVRGMDLLSSTPRQILLFEALGFPIPDFVHVPLWLDSNGQRLSKRLESEGLAPMRARGVTPQQVLTRLAASCGLGEAEQLSSVRELVERYQGSRYDIMRAIINKEYQSLAIQTQSGAPLDRG